MADGENKAKKNTLKALDIYPPDWKHTAYNRTTSQTVWCTYPNIYAITLDGYYTTKTRLIDTRSAVGCSSYAYVWYPPSLYLKPNVYR